MAQMLNIEKKFEDFSSLEIAIQQYHKEENVQFLRHSSGTIEKAQPRMPVGLPRLRNLVNVYTSLITETMPFTHYFQIDFFPLCSSVKSPIFLTKKTPLKNVPCAIIRKLFLVGCCDRTHINRAA